MEGQPIHIRRRHPGIHAQRLEVSRDLFDKCGQSLFARCREGDLWCILGTRTPETDRHGVGLPVFDTQDKRRSDDGKGEAPLRRLPRQGVIQLLRRARSVDCDYRVAVGFQGHDQAVPERLEGPLLQGVEPQLDEALAQARRKSSAGMRLAQASRPAHSDDPRGTIPAEPRRGLGSKPLKGLVLTRNLRP